MEINPYNSLTEPTIRYCEANVNGWIEQPANSFSSLVISLAGLFILTRKEKHAFSLWLGWVAILTGVASFVYHATFTFIGQLGDLGSMFLLGSFLFVASRRVLSKGVGLLILVVGTVLPLAITEVFRTVGGFNIGIPLFGVLLLTSIISELATCRREKRNTTYFGLAFAVFAVGFGAWILDLSRIWCNPATFHFINGHSVWHGANAVALLLLDRHYSQKVSS